MAIGWMLRYGSLSNRKAREELYPLYKAEHPDDTSNIVIGQQVGQIARFLLEMKAGDYVDTRRRILSNCTMAKLAADPFLLLCPRR